MRKLKKITGCFQQKNIKYRLSEKYVDYIKYLSYINYLYNSEKRWTEQYKKLGENFIKGVSEAFEEAQSIIYREENKNG